MLDRFKWVRQEDNNSIPTYDFLPDGLDLEANRLWWVDCYKQYGAHRLVRGPFSGPDQFSKTKHFGVLPAWANFDLGYDELGFSGGFEIIDGRGWPFVCLRSRFKIGGESTFPATKWSYIESTSVIKSGLLLADKKAPTLIAGWALAEARRSLPIQVIPGRFIFNTVFYTVMLVTIIYGPGVVRMVYWKRRGCCTKCGYDLRGTEHDVCPECGTA